MAYAITNFETRYEDPDSPVFEAYRRAGLQYETVKLSSHKWANVPIEAIAECNEITDNNPVILKINDKISFLVGRSWVPLFGFIILQISLDYEFDLQEKIWRIFNNKDLWPSWERIFAWTMCVKYADLRGFALGYAPFNSKSDGLCYSKYEGCQPTGEMTKMMSRLPLEQRASSCSLENWAAERRIAMVNCKGSTLPLSMHDVRLWGAIIYPAVEYSLLYNNKNLQCYTLVHDNVKQWHRMLLTKIRDKHKKIMRTEAYSNTIGHCNTLKDFVDTTLVTIW